MKKANALLVVAMSLLTFNAQAENKASASEIQQHAKDNKCWQYKLKVNAQACYDILFADKSHNGQVAKAYRKLRKKNGVDITAKKEQVKKEEVAFELERVSDKELSAEELEADMNVDLPLKVDEVELVSETELSPEELEANANIDYTHEPVVEVMIRQNVSADELEQLNKGYEPVINERISDKRSLKFLIEEDEETRDAPSSIRK